MLSFTLVRYGISNLFSHIILTLLLRSLLFVSVSHQMLMLLFTLVNYSMSASASAESAPAMAAASTRPTENPVLGQMVAYGIKEVRQPFESMVFGACWLSYVGGGRRLQKYRGKASDKSCRDLFRETETEKEKAEREAAGKDLDSMKVWPNWIKNARSVAGRLHDLEKAGKGPSPVIREEFPDGKVEDLAAICRRLVDLAFGSGLRRDRVNDFKNWLSTLLELLNSVANFIRNAGLIDIFRWTGSFGRSS